jgi:hypothetical protein
MVVGEQYIKDFSIKGIDENEIHSIEVMRLMVWDTNG